MKKEIVFIIGMVLISTGIFGQRRGKTTPQKQETQVEQSLVTCEGVNYQERPILGVVDFNVTATGTEYRIGTGMSDMLSNALVECNCFRVVERDRLAKVQAEQQLQGVASATAVKMNQLTGAQLLVMGNITEFQENTSGMGGIAAARLGGNIGLGGFGKVSAHVGMIIKIVHATTGEILVSKSLERKVSKMGALGGGLFGIPIGGAFFKSKAMEDAIEETIKEAVALIVNQKENLPNAQYKGVDGGTQLTQIVASQADFSKLMRLVKSLEAQSYVSKVDKSLNSNVANLTIHHSSDMETIMMDLSGNSNLGMAITGFDDYSIHLSF